MTVFNPFTGKFETSITKERFEREYEASFSPPWSLDDIEKLKTERAEKERDLLRRILEKPGHVEHRELVEEAKLFFREVTFERQPNLFIDHLNGDRTAIPGNKVIKGIRYDGSEISYSESEGPKPLVEPFGGRKAGKSRGLKKIREALNEKTERMTESVIKGKLVDWIIKNDMIGEGEITKAPVRAKETKWTLDEEIGGEMKWDKQLVGKAFEPHIFELDEAFSSSNGFLLSEPKNVTRKTKDEGFSKIPLIGGERLEGIRCYMGKRDGIIFVFETEGVDGTIEMNGAQALESLEGFEDFINRALGKNISEQVLEMAMSAEDKKRQQAIKEAQEVYSTEFGSW